MSEPWGGQDREQHRLWLCALHLWSRIKGAARALCWGRLGAHPIVAPKGPWHTVCMCVGCHYLWKPAQIKTANVLQLCLHCGMVREWLPAGVLWLLCTPGEQEGGFPVCTDYLRKDVTKVGLLLLGGIWVSRLRCHRVAPPGRGWVAWCSL